MTDTSTNAAQRGASASGKPARLGLFARLVLFVRQVIDELRKVVRPTRQELLNYTAVVVVFICLVMAFVVGLDQVFERLVSWALGD
ncbi:preprotein translocase subunit SecE [Allobranchiibius sp. CTAmp26]|uniref:preprotein translocase subunit SecE n=1 Tax=Allobranchiibius sp. CTAmp26 TaxID=2815214 RepID=UPI001AA1999E|nr:preprotein translocase subunit SecE [Allobranchiibius sp. CTAmp26]MBO1756441.1 preprotein translocase subunit SecE [Allobranchiibius sp. CTAmp26]